jgi:hypothetical protein
MNTFTKVAIAAALMLVASIAIAKNCVSGARCYKIMDSTGATTTVVVCTGAGGNCTTAGPRAWAVNGCDM